MVVQVVEIWFYELRMLQKWFIAKGQLSCIHHVIYMMNIFCSMFLQGSYRILRWCVDSTLTWYMMWWKTICSARNISFFLTDTSFWNVLSVIGFLDGLSIVRWMHSMWKSQMCTAWLSIFFIFLPSTWSQHFLCCDSWDHNILYIAIHAIVIFFVSRVWALDHAGWSFYGSQAWFLGPIACFEL